MKRFLSILILTFSCVVTVGQTYQVGDLYTAPDGSQGIVYFLHPDGTGGWVAALTDASTGCTWGDATDVAGIENHSTSISVSLMTDTSGYANTQAIRQHQNNNTSYAAGKVDFANGWCLPSPAQLRMLSAQWPRISSAMNAAGGSGLASAKYWTSAEYSASSAWICYFGPQNSLQGGLSNENKSSSCRVRAVRSFTYEAGVDLSYEWSTGATTSSITVSPEETTTYTVTVTVTGGYTDTVETTVVVNSVYSTEFTITSTEPYIWGGVTYSQSGNYTRTFTSAAGCDSVVTLHLTVPFNPEVAITTTSDSICVGDEVVLEASLLNSNEILLIQAASIGDILCTDNTLVKPSDWPVAGKTAKGIVFYVDNTGEHGWAVHLHDQSTSIPWGEYGTNIYTIMNYSTARSAISDIDGYSNTQYIREANPTNTNMAAYVVDFNDGWYLPAAGQLRLLFAEMMTLNASLQIVNGTQFPMDTYFWYWTSTECSNYNAWHIRSDGYISDGTKDYSRRVRGIRSF